MSKLSQEQESILTEINTLLAMVERYGQMELNGSFNITVSPIKILLNVMQALGVSYDEIIEFLSSMIVSITPVVDLAVKGILLAKLKSDIDCNLDPRIPKNMREEIKGVNTIPIFDMKPNENVGSDDINARGIEIDISTIDYYGMLNESPMSEKGRYKYFGNKKYYTVEGVKEKFYEYEQVISYCLKKGINKNLIKKHSDVDTIHEFVRAKDFNAFLWYVLHKAKFINVSTLRNEDIPEGESILKEYTGVDTNNTYFVGQTYYQGVGNEKYGVIGMCIKNTPILTTNETFLDATPNSSNKEMSDIALETQKQKTNESQYCVVPITNLWNGLNWYVNRFFNNTIESSNNVLGTNFKHDPKKDFALFNISTQYVNGRLTNKLLFTIKPAPNLILPSVGVSFEKKKNDKGEEKTKLTYNGQMQVSRLTFDYEGKQKLGGKYSVIVGEKDKEKSDLGKSVFNVLNPVDNSITPVKLHVTNGGAKYELKNDGGTSSAINSVLYECYPGFTVYEFNYDFIMGIQLFESSVIVAQLIEALSNVNIGAEFNLTPENAEYKMRISEIVKNIIETSGYESSDCFYSFSNKEYNDLLNKSELKRLQLYPFNSSTEGAVNVSDKNIYELLNECNVNSTLEEKINVVSSTLTQASAVITEEVMPDERYEISFCWATKAVEMVVSIFVEALLTPKFLFVLAINKKIMGEGKPGTKIDIKYYLEQFWNIIESVAREIVEIILSKITEFVIKKIKELLEKAAKILMLEQIEYYLRLIESLIKACTFKFGGEDLMSRLDNVDYADIDNNMEPITGEC